MVVPQYVEIGPDGHEYLSWMLDSGGILASALAERLDLSVGKVVALVPTPAQPIDYGKLMSGGGLASYAASRDWLIHDGQEFVTGGPSRCIISIDYSLPKDRVRRESFECPIVSIQKEPLHVCTAENSDGLREMITWCDRHRCFIAVFSSHPHAERWQHGTTISQQDITTIAEATQAVIVDAFDGESFIMWRPLDAMG